LAPLAAMPIIVFSLWAVTTPSAQAQTYTVLYNFQGGTDGDFPFAGLVRDAGGNLYGTTTEGGTSNFGTVFKVSGNAETILYNFKGGTDGETPRAPVIRDAAGNLYGTTGAGGSSGLGTVFKISANGTETVLHSFAGGTADGCNPYGGLLRDKAGNLYGTTNQCGASDIGTIFKVKPNGKETVLHNFAGNPSDGSYPYLTSLLMDKKGSLYGVAQNGGTGNLGVIYKLSKSGKLTVLHNFAAGTDGCYPYGSPTMDKTGTLYGTTYDCGSSNKGVVWKLSKNGTETVLHTFLGGTTDGEAPWAGVILDPHGNLYGDTIEGGTVDLGIVYELSKTGTFSVLHSFDGYTGEYPYGGLIRDAAGNLYSTAFSGGSSGYAGNVWEVTP
jgi:uncharacterized repeat protein (TIGR03803 family)